MYKYINNIKYIQYIDKNVKKYKKGKNKQGMGKSKTAGIAKNDNSLYNNSKYKG